MVVPPGYNAQQQPKVEEKPEVVKKKGWRRFREIFLAEDFGTVKGKVFEGVVVPSIKDFIVNVVCDGVTMLVKGEAASVAKKRIQSSFLTGSGNRVSYTGYWAGGSNTTVQSVQKLAPNMITGYVEPVFKDPRDAKECLSDIIDIMDQYGVLTISDLYSTRSVSNEGGYTIENVYSKWGWKHLGNANVSMNTSGLYTLNLPRPKLLDIQ